jgi:spore coat protein U-like protein
MMLRRAALVAACLPVLAHAATCGVSAPAADFGAYDVFSTTALTTTTTIGVTCTLTASDGGGNTDVAYVIAISAGASNAFVQRQMRSGSASLAYNLYTDSARTQVWGDGTGASRTVAASIRLNPGHSQDSNSHTVYASAPAQQDAAVGAYADTLLVTITY